MTKRHARISRGNPPVPLELKTSLQAYRFELNWGKQRVLNTGWLGIFSNMYFGSFLTPKKLRTAALRFEVQVCIQCNLMHTVVIINLYYKEFYLCKKFVFSAILDELFSLSQCIFCIFLQVYMEWCQQKVV